MRRSIATFAASLLLVVAGGVSVAQSPTPEAPDAAALLGFSEDRTIDVETPEADAADTNPIGRPLAFVFLVALALPLGVALLMNRRGHQADDRAAAREREKAMLREVAGAPNLNYLVAMVWARWLGLTRSDRRLVYGLWLGLSFVTFSLVVLEVMSAGLNAQSVLGMAALSLITIGTATIALMFRLPR